MCRSFSGVDRRAKRNSRRARQWLSSAMRPTERYGNCHIRTYAVQRHTCVHCHLLVSFVRDDPSTCVKSSSRTHSYFPHSDVHWDRPTNDGRERERERRTKSTDSLYAHMYVSSSHLYIRVQVCVYQNIAGKQTDRTYTFDKSFGPATEQEQLYNTAICPIVDEVLDGFNCTIFAYGQTGTGKTYTVRRLIHKYVVYTHFVFPPEPSVRKGHENRPAGAHHAVLRTMLAMPMEQMTHNIAICIVVICFLCMYVCVRISLSLALSKRMVQMEGELKDVKKAGITEHCGVIPRAVNHIFDKLEGQGAEYSVKATFLELYNEELTDLLAVGDDMPMTTMPSAGMAIPGAGGKPKLALMEDGKGGVIVRGLEEEIVKNSNEIFTVLQRGSSKRRSAETLLNKQSSRSHSVFTITIHIKEATPEGEELIKCGKLNLVDLAGSENVSRSGANMRPESGRTREAGEINKSLLTLGRVITALVEHQGHVPYRDSKLTRLLRDSLGGRTKTCIIATVAPTVHCLEETLSTLDYAHRAKNIRNKPEVNQKMTKNALLKDLNLEILRLKEDLIAARDKNGIYLSKERYEEELSAHKAGVAMIEALEAQIAELEAEKVKLTDLFTKREEAFKALEVEHKQTESDLEATRTDLSQTKSDLGNAMTGIAERDYLIVAKNKSETLLADHSKTLARELDRTASDVDGLFNKLDRKKVVDDTNALVVRDLQTEVGERVESIETDVAAMLDAQRDLASAHMQKANAFRAEHEKLLEVQRTQIIAMHAGLNEALLAAVSKLTGAAKTAGDAKASASSLHASAREGAEASANEAVAAVTAIVTMHSRQQEAYRAQVAALCDAQVAAAHEQQRHALTIGEKLEASIGAMVTNAKQRRTEADENCATAGTALSDFASSFTDNFNKNKMDFVSEVNALMTKFIASQQAAVDTVAISVTKVLDSERVARATAVEEMEVAAKAATDEASLAMKDHKATVDAVISRADDAKAAASATEAENCGELKAAADAATRAAETAAEKQRERLVAADECLERMATDLSGVASCATDDARTATASSESHLAAASDGKPGVSARDFVHAAVAAMETQREDISTRANVVVAGVVGVNDIVVDHVVRKMMQDTITGQTPLKRDIEVPEVSLIDKMRCPEDTEVLRSFYSQLEEKEQNEDGENGAHVDDAVDTAELNDAGNVTLTKGLAPLVISEDVDCDDSDGSGNGSLGSARSNGGGSKNRTPFAVIEGNNSAPASPQRRVATTEA